MPTTENASNHPLAWLASDDAFAAQDAYDERKEQATDECPACTDRRGHGPSACPLGH